MNNRFTLIFMLKNQKMAYPKITKGQYRTRLDDIDLHHRLTAYGAIGFAQEAAWQASVEAEISIPKLLETGYTWILNRIFLKVYEMPKYGEIIDFETFVAKSERFVSQRDGRFLSDDKLLFEIATQWLFVDVVQKKLAKIPDEMTAALLNTERVPIEVPNSKISDLQSADYQYNTTVRWHDLDINNHTTNRQYIRWCVDAIPSEILNENSIKSLDFQFKNESILNEKLIIQALKIEDGFIHKITSENGKEIVRGSIRFTD
jgi:medium-chain acyl-[acyl-carrier-protein] hydrolase